MKTPGTKQNNYNEELRCKISVQQQLTQILPLLTTDITARHKPLVNPEKRFFVDRKMKIYFSPTHVLPFQTVNVYLQIYCRKLIWHIHILNNTSPYVELRLHTSPTSGPVIQSLINEDMSFDLILIHMILQDDEGHILLIS